MSHPGDADWEIPEDSSAGVGIGGCDWGVARPSDCWRSCGAWWDWKRCVFKGDLPGTLKDDPENGKRDPYYSHIFRDSYGSGMGTVWGPRGAGLSGPLRVHEMRMEKVLYTIPLKRS